MSVSAPLHRLHGDSARGSLAKNLPLLRPVPVPIVVPVLDLIVPPPPDSLGTVGVLVVGVSPPSGARN